ncbi:hypothetical protein OFN54_32260, partial [Escherichia coli]|nr:hypothetical protein [Escherichia coli]
MAFVAALAHAVATAPLRAQRGDACAPPAPHADAHDAAFLDAWERRTRDTPPCALRAACEAAAWALAGAAHG